MAHSFTVDRIQAIWDMLGGDEVVDLVLAGKAKIRVEMVRYLSDVTFDLVRLCEHQPRALVDLAEILILDDFTDRVLSGVVDPVTDHGFAVIGCADLIQEANDEQIMSELSEITERVFRDVDHFLACLATLVAGETEGVVALHQDHKANIFYVQVAGEVLAIELYREVAGLGWHCVAAPLKPSPWEKGSRIFIAQ